MDYEPSIVACMICRGTETTIPDCIRSLKAQGVDLLNVTLNQEQDDTLIIQTCAEVDLPYAISKFEWCDDTGASRQFNLEQVDIDNFDWAIWVDSDDTVESAKIGITLRDIVKQAATAGVDVVWMWYQYSFDQSGNPTNIFRRERLFRTALIGPNKLHWKGIIHEVLMNLEGYNNSPTEDIYIKHHHQNIERKERNMRQLEKALAAEPDNPRFIMYMGHHYSASGQPALAYQWYLKFAEDPRSSAPERWQALHYASSCARGLGLFEEGERAATAAVALFPELVEPYIELGIINFYKGEYDKAIHWFQQTEGKRRSPDLLFFNPMYVTNERDIHLALTLAAQGKFSDALPLVLTSAERDPKNTNLTVMTLKFKEANLREETIRGIKALCVSLLAHSELLKLRDVLSVLPWWFTEMDEEFYGLKSSILEKTKLLDAEQNKEFYLEHSQGTGPWCEEDAPRYKWLVKKVGEWSKGQSVLDVGGGNGVLAELLIAEGHKVVVVEPNPKNCEELTKKGIVHSKRFFDEFVPKGRFDTVIMTEYLEHSLDPQKDFDKAFDCGDRVLITVPRPSYGDFDGVTEFRDHVRVFTIDELERLITSKKGRRLENLSVEEGITPDVGNVLMEVTRRVWNKEARTWKFFEAASPEEWNPHTKITGGSELALRELTSQLDKQKETVFTYYNGSRCVYKGVPFRNFKTYPLTVSCDVLVSSRVPEMLASPLPVGQKYLWAHDVHYGDKYVPELEEAINGVLLESEFHRTKWLEQYPWSQKTFVLGAGIAGDFTPILRKDPSKPKFVWTSSPVRGLDRMLDMWPLILERWPEATLDIFYGWEWFDRVQGSTAWPYLKAKISSQVESLGGVTWKGRTPHDEVVRFLRDEATVWLYPPNPFEEIYCAAAVEAQAAGLLCLYRENGALPEVVGDRGIPLPMDISDLGVVTLLEEHMEELEVRQKASEWGRKQTWAKVANKLRGIVNDNETRRQAESGV